jgi:hypothetical protein
LEEEMRESKLEEPLGFSSFFVCRLPGALTSQEPVCYRILYREDAAIMKYDQLMLFQTAGQAS